MSHASHHTSHHSSSHYHRSYHYYGDRGTSDIWASIIVIAILLLICLGISSIEESSRKERISGRDPLADTSYEVTEYLYDAEGYFSEPEALENGLKYFHKRTGVQLVVTTINQNFSDEKALVMYNQLFDDESHVLLIIPTTYQQSVKEPIQFYAIGDDANSVVSDDTIDYLLDKISNSSSGASWQYHLEEIANIIVNNE